MTLHTVALALRAWRIDARDLKANLLRILPPAIVLGALIVVHLDRGSWGAPGATLFSWITTLNYVVTTLAGVTLFATTISEECEDRTLDLLRLAGISPFSILLGKWVPRLTSVAWLVILQFPFILLAVTLGGVHWEQIGQATLLLLAHLWLVGSLGLFASVLRRRNGPAVATALIVMLAFHVLPFLLQSAASQLFANGFLAAPLFKAIDSSCNFAFWSNCWSVLSELLNLGANLSAVLFATGVNLAAGAVLFFASLIAFDPLTRQETARMDAASPGRRRRHNRPWSFPIVWKDFHFLTGGTKFNVLKLLGYAAVSLFAALYWVNWDLSQIDAATLGGAIFAITVPMLVVEGTFLAARVYHTEAAEQTWCSLALLPVSLPEIAYAKLCGACFGFVPALLVLFVGIGLRAEDVLDFFEDLFNDKAAFYVFSYLFLQVLIGWHVISILSVTSLRIAWPAALAGGIACMAAGNFAVISFVVTSTSGPQDAEGLLLLLCVLSLGVLVAAHGWMATRLDALSGET